MSQLPPLPSLEVRLAMGLAEGTLHMLHETVSKHQMGATMRHLPGREPGGHPPQGSRCFLFFCL